MPEDKFKMNDLVHIEKSGYSNFITGQIGVVVFKAKYDAGECIGIKMITGEYSNSSISTRISWSFIVEDDENKIRKFSKKESDRFWLKRFIDA